MRRLVNVSAAVLLVGHAGCAAKRPLYEVNRSTRQDAAGSTQLAVLAIAPWERYSSVVQPTFKLSSDDALAQAVPNTLSLEEKILSAFAIGLKTALPQSTFTETRAVHSESGKDAVEVADRTETVSSGDASQLAFGEGPAGTRTASALPPANSVLATPIGLDNMLKYWAATALYQEVQILNRYIRDAAVEKGYDPYVVRLQIVVTPFRRQQPYDVYTTVSFFGGAWGTPRQAPPPPELRRTTSAKEQKAPTPDDESTTDVPTGENDVAVRVLPLLVTDNIESAMHSRSINELRRVALALSAVTAGIGASADLQRMEEDLRTVIGRDLNSTFTASRLTDNTLQCRFGAAHQAAAHYAMVPQTHNVTLLLLVPKGADNQTAADVRLTARTSFVDVDTGLALPAQTQDEAYVKLSTILKKRYKLKGNPQKDAAYAGRLRELFRSVAANEYRVFKDEVNAMIPNASMVDALWADVAALRNDSPYASATLRIPEKRVPRILDGFRDQTPVLQDDNKSATTTIIRGGDSLDAATLGATVTVRSNAPGASDVVLPASAIKVADSGKEATLTFPSLTAYKLLDKPAQPPAPVYTTVVSLFVTGDASNPPQQLLSSTGNHAIHVAARAQKVGFTMTTRARFVAASNSKGHISVVFSELPGGASARLAVEGADAEVTAVPPSIAVPDKAGWKINGNGVLSIALSNLTPLAPLTLTATDEPSTGSPPHSVVLPVLEDTPQRSAVAGGR